MLTDAEKVAVRRFCGYGIAGTVLGGMSSYRFFQSYGLLEWRMRHLSADEEAVLRTTYLTPLAQLETDVLGVRDNLDTDKAAVWTHNKNEQSDREALFDEWRRRLCAYLMLPVGPGLRPQGYRMVV